LLCATSAVVWHLNGVVSVTERASPPPMPFLPETARPKLVVSTPLPPLAAAAFAKPVIAADHERRIVVAQALTPQESQLVQWRAVQGNAWAAPEFFEHEPRGKVSEYDPWLETDRRGQFSLVDVDSPQSDHGLGLALRRSTDGTRSWSTPESIVTGADRPVLGVSPNGAYWVVAASLSERRENSSKQPLDGNDPHLQEKIAAMFRYSSGVFVSQNEGQSWQRLPGPLGESHTVPFSVVVDDRGRIASSWIDANGPDVIGVPAHSRSVVAVTVDRGVHWVETELVSKLQPDRRHPFNGERFPVVSVDVEDRLHVAYVESLGAGLSVRHSDDWKGWSGAMRLSQASAEEVRLPAIAALGPMVHVIWAERHQGRWAMSYRGSRNAGESWSERIGLTRPDESQFDLTSDDDQFCVRDDGAGTVHAVWAVRGKGPAFSGARVWYAAIKWQRD
jgi:hypothetical protein